MKEIDDVLREKMLDGRRRATDAVNHTEVATDRRQAHQVASRKLSIQNFCRECHGFDPGGSGGMAAAVRECQAVECWLWPWRDGSLDPTLLPSD